MKTRVGLSHEPKRKLPWLVYWFGEPDDSGRQRKYSKTFRYQRKARAFQAKKQTELDRGGPRDRVEDVTLGRLLDEFWEARVAGLSFKSRECYQNTLDQLREHFGNQRPIRGIKQRHAETFMTSRKRRDGRTGGLSTWTRRQRLTHCRAVFQAAVDWDHLEANPFRVPAGAGSSPLRVKAKSRPWHHLRPDEFQRMLTVVPSVKRRAAYWLMYGCGLRPGEAYNLTIDRISLDNRCVHIANRDATGDIPPFVVKCDERTTESKERTVSIPKAALPDVTAACQEAFRSGGFVILTAERFATVQRCWRLCREGKPWGGRETHRPWQNRDMMNNLLRDTKAYLDKVGVKLTAPFTLTTFRKSFAQNHADAGTPPKTLAKLLGHVDARITTQYYNRVTDANEQAAAQAMDRLLKQAKRSRGVG
ncbi:MAG: tyrosine-type recombinase/integrase [Phycisphaerales bacterium]|nr:MAG: tyrosine-type recombinase/integrase [Phycisphaerales bacterium]